MRLLACVCALFATAANSGVQIVGDPFMSVRMGEVVQLARIRSFDSSNNATGNVNVRAEVEEGCGTFAGGGRTVEFRTDGAGFADVPSFTALAFNRRCNLLLHDLTPGQGPTSAPLVIYDPATLVPLVQHRYSFIEPGTTFRVLLTALAGGRVPVRNVPVSLEVVTLDGEASAILSADSGVTDVHGSLSVEATANDQRGTYEIRARIGSAVDIRTVTQGPANRLRAVAPTGSSLSVGLLDGGAQCAFEDSAAEPNPAAPLPGWRFYGVVRVSLSGCSREDVRIGMNIPTASTEAQGAAVVMRHGRLPGEAAARWHLMPGEKRGPVSEFALRDGVDDADGSRDGRLTAVLAYALPIDDHNGMWWVGPAENGWGMSVIQRRDTLFCVVYAYDDQGKPTWYVMPGGTWNAAYTTYTGTLYRPRGAPFYAYDARAFAPGSPVGTMSLTIQRTSLFAFAMEYTINGIAGRKELQKQFLPQFGSNWVPSGMWWGGDDQVGWGVASVTQGQNMFNVWFTYDASGEPTWFVMPQVTYVGDAFFTAPLYRTVGSPWLGRAYDPARLQSIVVGDVRLQFSGDIGLMDYLNDDRLGQLRLYRQLF